MDRSISNMIDLKKLDSFLCTSPLEVYRFISLAKAEIQLEWQKVSVPSRGR